MTGRRDDTLAEIEYAVDAGMSDAWEQLVLGILELYSGNMGEAVQYLERATDLDADCLAAQAMLAVAYDLTDRTGEHMQLMHEIMDRKPKNSLDIIFLAHAQLYVSPDLAHRTLESLPADDDSALARLILADIQNQRAMDMGSATLSDRALRNLDAAAVYVKSSTYVNGLELFALNIAVRLRREMGEPVDSLLERGDALVADPNRFGDNDLWHLGRSFYYRDCHSDKPRARSILEEAVRAGARSVSLSNYAALLYEAGEYRTALDVLKQHCSNGDTPAAVAMAGLLAFEARGSNEQFIELYEQADDTNHRWSSWTPEMILLFVDDTDYVTSECARRIEVFGDQPWEAWSKDVVRFCAGQLTSSQLVGTAGELRSRRSLAHFLIAMKSIVDKRMSDAKYHFRQCEEANYLDAYWATAFLAAMETQLRTDGSNP